MREPARPPREDHAPRSPARPPARPRRSAGAPERVLALVGVSALLGIGVVSVLLVLRAARGDDEDESPVVAATATPTPTPTATPKPRPTPVPLTPEQKEERRRAVDLLASRNFEAVRLRDYDPRKTLRVLIGRSTSGSRLAFFFVNGDYIGNDATEPSAELEVARNGDLRVTLSYGIFAPGDPPDDPSGGPVRVRFAWDGARLTPLDPIPVPEQRTPGRQAQ